MSFNRLPIDVLLKIYSWLSPEELANVAQVNKISRRVLNAQLIWKNKFELHFPHLLKEIKVEPNHNWYQAFKQAYDSEYKDLPLPVRKMFSLVKEGDLDELKKCHIQFEDLHQYDTHLDDLTYYARRHQATLDYLYQEIILPFYTIDADRVDVLKKDTYQRTLLYWAAGLNQSEAVALLVASGANAQAANNYGYTPLHIAAYYGHVDVVNALIAQKANVGAADNRGATPLYIAAYYGYVDVVNALIAQKANVGAAVNSGSTPLHIAAQNGHLDVVNALIMQKANVDAANINGATPLHIAAYYGHVDVVNALIMQKANVDAAIINGATPLYLAALRGQLDVVKALIAQKANVNVVGSGITMLRQALNNNHSEVALVLLNAGSEFTQDDFDVALKSNHPDLIKAMEIKLLEAYIATRGAKEMPEYTSKGGEFLDKFSNLFRKADEQIKPRSKQAKVAAAEARLRELRGEDRTAISKEQQQALATGKRMPSITKGKKR